MCCINTLIVITIIYLSSSLVNTFKINQKHLFNNQIISHDNKIINFHSKRLKTIHILKFKVSANDQETLVDDEEIKYETFDGNSFLKKISNGIVPIAASVGFAATPSSSLAIRFAGATIGSLAGIIARRSLLNQINPKTSNNNDDRTLDSGKLDYGNGGDGIYSSKVAKALDFLTNVNDISTWSLNDIERIAKKFTIPKDELSIFFTYLFSEIIFKATDSESLDLTELSTVIDFAVNNELTTNEIGDGFTLAAIRVGKQLEKDDQGFFTSNYSLKLLYQSSKIFFLADKIMSNFNGYYGQRLNTALLGFPIESYHQVITSACSNLYKRCIESVLMNPNSFTKEEISNIKQFLLTNTLDISSFRSSNMESIVKETLDKLIDNTLQNTANNKNILTHIGNEKNIQLPELLDINLFNINDIIQAKQLLNYNNYEFDQIIEKKTFPIFHLIVKKIFHSIIKNSNEINSYINTIETKMNDLYINRNKAKTLVIQLINELNSNYLLEIEKLSTSTNNNIEYIYKYMVSYSKSYDNIIHLVENILQTNYYNTSLDISIPIPKLPFSELIKSQLYELNNEKKLINNDKLFNLNDKQVDIINKTLIINKIISWITNCINQNNISNNTKNVYIQLLSQYNITREEWVTIGLDYYYNYLIELSNKVVIPSNSDIDKLESIKEFLDLNNNQSNETEYNYVTKVINNIHIDVYSEKFIKALDECMTPTNVISEDYYDSLHRLGDRLGLTTESTIQLLSLTIRNKLKSILSSIYNTYQSVNDKNKKPKPIEDEKLGFNNKPDNSLDSNIDSNIDNSNTLFMNEIKNLIDFYVENYKLFNISIDLPFTESANYTLPTESLSTKLSIDSITSDQVITQLPVLATEVLPEVQLISIYKQYLINSIIEKNDVLQANYQSNQLFLSNLFGLTSENQFKVKKSIAYQLIKRIIRNVLNNKPYGIETSDYQQISYIISKLQLDSYINNEIYDQVVKDTILEKGKYLFGNEIAIPGKGIINKNVNVNSDLIQTFRTQISSLGYEIYKDFEFNSNFLVYLYALEVQSSIESNQLDRLADIQESYNISDDIAQIIIIKTIKKYLNQLLNISLRLVKKYQEKEVVSYLSKVVNYLPFLTNSNEVIECDGNLFTNLNKEKLIQYYQSNFQIIHNNNVENIDVNDISTRLNDLIFLTKDYVPPINGLEGILGKTTDLKEIMVAGSAANKKRWAWG